MSPLILASQSQALPLLFLPLAMSAGHSSLGLRHVHANAHAQTIAAIPMLFPVNAASCSANVGDDRMIGNRYVLVVDQRFGLNVGSGIRRAQ